MKFKKNEIKAMHGSTNPRTPTLFVIIQPWTAQVFIVAFWCAPEPKTQHQGHPDED